MTYQNPHSAAAASTETASLMQHPRGGVNASTSTSYDADNQHEQDLQNKKSSTRKALLTVTGLAAVFCFLVVLGSPSRNSSNSSTLSTTSSSNQFSDLEVERLGKSNSKSSKKKHHHHHHTFVSRWSPRVATPRCDWVMTKFDEKDEGTAPADLRLEYLAQAVNPNVFYRATATIFWSDFAHRDVNFTGHFLLYFDPDQDDKVETAEFYETKGVLVINGSNPELDNIQKLDGVPMAAKSVWTWVTGDQHLSNFGAWRNRHSDIVFGVNDFDEAAIFDFQIDIVRIAVSICSHAYTNGLDEKEIDHALREFTDSYVETVLGYEDNEKALLFELTPKTTKDGTVLQEFLDHVENKKSTDKQMTKFTTRDPETNERHFIKGPGIDVPHDDTNLAPVHPSTMEEIKQAFSKTHYGASMMKLGWAVLPWDDTFFTVLDVAARIGSGIGSFGVDRYYVLLKGRDGLLLDDGEDGSAVILDVKFQPKSAVMRVLNEQDEAWYKVMFPNEAARVVEAQRRLTSYTDPFTGWVTLNGKPFSVRQRSPWKASPNLDELTSPKDFNEFVAQIAVATATSHVRGSVAKAPGDFKHSIAAILGGQNNKHKRKEWGEVIGDIAKAYRKQVLMDWECFHDFVENKYGKIEG